MKMTMTMTSTCSKQYFLMSNLKDFSENFPHKNVLCHILCCKYGSAIKKVFFSCCITSCLMISKLTVSCFLYTHHQGLKISQTVVSKKNCLTNNNMPIHIILLLRVHGSIVNFVLFECVWVEYSFNGLYKF